MKKKLLLIVFALGLVLLVGCGQKYINSGDDESKYRYGWIMNEKKHTTTLCVKGKWDKDCAWQAEYDESVFSCEPGKRKGRFTVGSYGAAGGDLFLRLYRQGQEDWEYALQFSLQGDGAGGVIVLSSAHEEPLQEGTYNVFQMDNGTYFMINTAHQWRGQVIGEDIQVVNIGSTEGMEQFSLTAKNTSVQGVEVEFCDSESPLVLTVVADIDENGVIEITDVQEGNESKYAEKTVELFWKQLGFKAPISDMITIRSAYVINDDTHGLYGIGDMDVTIGDADYKLYISLLPRMAELRIPEEFTDIVTQEVVPVNITEEMIGPDNVTFYQQTTDVTAIWEHFGCHYVLEGYSTNVAAMKEAVGDLMGV